MSLSDRQWNQIRAALAFWRAVAETSRVHPIQHPAVQSFFGDDHPTPLTDDEINALSSLPLAQFQPWTTVSFAAREFNVGADRIRAELKRTSKEPKFMVGNIRIYDTVVLSVAVIAIQKRDEAYRKKYHVADSKT